LFQNETTRGNKPGSNLADKVNTRESEHLPSSSEGERRTRRDDWSERLAWVPEGKVTLGWWPKKAMSR